MANIGQGRPLRVCDLCGGVDDHPRHVITASTPGDHFERPSDDTLARVIDAAPAEHRARLISELLDTGSTDRHLDCCAAAGCPLPDGDPNRCDARLDGARGATGKRLLAHLTRED